MKDKQLEKFDRSLLIKQWRDSLDKGEFENKIYNHWKKYVPLIYDPEFDYNNPTQLALDDVSARDILFKPMEYFLCGGNPEEIFSSLKSYDSNLNVCGKVFKNGQPTYTCIDCAADGTCVLCSDCFQNSEHKKHRYKIFTSSGGGICDCGDVEAWKKDPYCLLHSPNDQITSNLKKKAIKEEEPFDNSDVIAKLPPDLVNRAGTLLMTTIQYSVLMLTWQNPLELPENLSSKSYSDKYVTMLYNDEIHTYEQVIGTLSRAIDCSHKEGVEFATTVDREGRSPVLIGNLNDCERVKATIERSTSRHGGKSLKVKVFQAYILAHQTFAYKLLIWMNYVIGQSEGLRFLLCIMTTQPFGIVNVEHSILEHLILHDTNIWKLARMKCHEIFMSTMLLFPETKRKLASTFTQHYSRILDDYMEDDQEHLASISCLSVQLYTVPSLARHLIIEKNVLAVVIETFIRVCQPYKNAEGKLTFDRNHPNNTFRRAQYILNDLHYLLLSPPISRDWLEPLKKNFLNGFNSMLNLLCSMQNMDSVVRQTGQHLDYEPEWETAFNVMYKLIPCLNSFEDWILASADKDCCVKTLGRTLKALYRLNKKFKHVTLTPKLKNLESKKNLNFKTKSIKYDVSVDPVSVHLPVTRLFTGLYLQIQGYGLNFYSPEFDYTQHCLSQTNISETLSTNSICDEYDASNMDIQPSTTEFSNFDENADDQQHHMVPLESKSSSSTTHERGGSFLKKLNTRKDSIINKDYCKIPSPLEIAEFPLRTLVLSAQVQAGMWRRNGYSLLNQVYLYHNAKWRHQMFDRDILTLQVTASLIIKYGFDKSNPSHIASSENSDLFVLNLLNKYDLVNFIEWINAKVFPFIERSSHSSSYSISDTILTSPKNFKEDDENIRLKALILEEFLHLIIMLTNERYTLEIGEVTEEDVLEREIIHQLCLCPLSHSELIKTLPEKDAKNPLLEKILSKIANLKKSIDAATKTKYHLKREYYQRFDPFYYHYTKAEQSKAEEYKKIRKLHTFEEKACPPPVPPKFRDSFKPLLSILDCDIIIHVLDLLLSSARALSSQITTPNFPQNKAEHSKQQLSFVSEHLVHEVLHISCIALYQERENNSDDFNFYQKFKKAGLNEKMRDLLEDHKFKSNHNLLLYTLKLYEEIDNEKLPKTDLVEFMDTATLELGGKSEPVSPIKTTTSTPCSSDFAQRKKRGDLAKSRRLKILSQMNKAQRSFIKSNRDLWDSIPPSSSIQVSDKCTDETNVIQVLTEEDVRKLQVETCPDTLEDLKTGIVADELEESFAGVFQEYSHFSSQSENLKNEYDKNWTATKERSYTCILCQEDQNLSNDTESLVMAALIQTSTVLRINANEFPSTITFPTSSTNGTITEQPTTAVPPVSANYGFAQGSNLTSLLGSDVRFTRGIVVKTCGHVMHSRCWHRFYDAVVARERRQALRFRFHHLVYDVDKNEYLCPLCNALSNATLPVLTTFRPSQTTISPSTSEIPFKYWLKLTNAIVKMSVLTSVPPKTEPDWISSDWKYLLRTREFEQILKLFTDEELPCKPAFRRLFAPSSINPCPETVKGTEDTHLEENQSAGIANESPTSTIDDLYSASILSMLKTFSLSLYTIAFDTDPFDDEKDDRLLLLVWNSCSFTIQSLDMLFLSDGDVSFIALLNGDKSKVGTDSLSLSINADDEADDIDKTAKLKKSIPERYTECLRFLIRYARTYTAWSAKPRLVKHQALSMCKHIFAPPPLLPSVAPSNATTFGLIPSTQSSADSPTSKDNQTVSSPDSKPLLGSESILEEIWIILSPKLDSLLQHSPSYPTDSAEHSFILDTDMFSALVKLCFSFHGIFDKNVLSSSQQHSDHGLICPADDSVAFLLRLFYIAQIVQILLIYPKPTRSDDTNTSAQSSTSEFMETEEKIKSTPFDYSDIPSTSKNIFWDANSKMNKEIKHDEINEQTRDANESENNCGLEDTVEDGFDISEDILSISEDAHYLYELWVTFKRVTFSEFKCEEDLCDSKFHMKLLRHVRISLMPFLRCCTIFFYYLTEIPIPLNNKSFLPLHSKPLSNKNASYFVPLCRYLNLPVSFSQLFRAAGPRLVDNLICNTWLNHPKVMTTMILSYQSGKAGKPAINTNEQASPFKPIGKNKSASPNLSTKSAVSYNAPNVGTKDFSGTKYKVVPKNFRKNSINDALSIMARRSEFAFIKAITNLTVSYPIKTPALISLPKDFADLINIAANFVCPNSFSNTGNNNNSTISDENYKSALATLNPINNLLQSAAEILETAGQLPLAPDVITTSASATTATTELDSRDLEDIIEFRHTAADPLTVPNAIASLNLLRRVLVNVTPPQYGTYNVNITTNDIGVPINPETDRLGIPVNPEAYLDINDDEDDDITMLHDPGCSNNASRAPTLCLVCGKLLCSQSYCCQSELIVHDNTNDIDQNNPISPIPTTVVPVGACTAHSYSCGAGIGIFLRIRECQILLLNGRNKGAFYTPPYIDAYGETDQGLRRGNPLSLCPERYKSLERIWLSNSIPNEIARALEINPNLLSIDWQHL